jgi:GntR family transcriptional regulator
MTKASSKRILIGAISPAADGPLYQQIVDGVRREISEGRLTPGDELPSFRALAEQLLVSLITVKRAYEELEREGIIFRRQGLGTFVAEQGASRSRANKAKQAEQHFRLGVAEATEAGLSNKEIIGLVTDLINKNQG